MIPKKTVRAIARPKTLRKPFATTLQRHSTLAKKYFSSPAWRFPKLKTIVMTPCKGESIADWGVRINNVLTEVNSNGMVPNSRISYLRREVEAKLKVK